jgi:threonine 3-dehydrogenase
VKALAKLRAEPGIWLTDVEPPQVQAEQVLIKIQKTAICGTDLHIYHWDDWAQATVPIPMVVGHEFFGEVVALGKRVHDLKLGDRVSGEGHLTCGQCRNCRAGRRHLCRHTRGIGYDCPGCFGEYFAMPRSNVYLLPDEITADQAAVLDPLGNATHTALAYDLVGEDVLITGAGPVGLMAAVVAMRVGARHVVITDVNKTRLDLARQLGVSKALDVSQDSIEAAMKDLGLLEGFDVGLEMSGNPDALNEMIEVMNHGGKLALLGILPNGSGVNWQKVVFKSLTMQGIYGRKIFETWHKMISLLQTGLEITPIITHQFPLKDYQEAFELMASGKTGKVILNWD